MRRPVNELSNIRLWKLTAARVDKIFRRMKSDVLLKTTMHLCCNATSKSTTRKPYPLDFGLPLAVYHREIITASFRPAPCDIKMWHKVILLVNLNKALHRYWAGPHYVFSYCSATTGFYLKPVSSPMLAHPKKQFLANLLRQSLTAQRHPQIFGNQNGGL